MTRACLHLVLLLAAGIASLASVDRAASQTFDPPATSPPDARYPTSSISYPTAEIGFPNAAIGYPGAAVGYPSAPIGFPTAALNSPTAARGTDGLSVREERGGLRFTLNADLLFDFDKAVLRPAADGVLKGLVGQVASRLPGGRFKVEGHTDAKGTDRYNDALSTRRAGTVRAWLIQNGGVPAARVSTTGFGKRRPVAPNAKPDGSDDPEGRQKNRRVEILVTR